MGQGDERVSFQWSEACDLKDLLGITGSYRGVYLIVVLLTRLYHNSVRVLFCLFSQSVMSDSLQPTPWTAASQASLSLTISWSLLKLMSVELVMPSKVLVVKVMVFLAVMYGCEIWTIKKAKCWIIDTFELCWRRLFRVRWTARRSNQSILKEINPEHSLEELILKLKFQHFSHLMQRADSLEDPDAGQGWRQKEMGSAADETDSIMRKLWETVKDTWAWLAAVCWVTKSQTWLSD